MLGPASQERMERKLVTVSTVKMKSWVLCATVGIRPTTIQSQTEHDSPAKPVADYVY